MHLHYILILYAYITYTHVHTCIQSIHRCVGRVHAGGLEAQGVLHSHGERHDELRGAGEVSDWCNIWAVYHEICVYRNVLSLQYEMYNRYVSACITFPPHINASLLRYRSEFREEEQINLTGRTMLYYPPHKQNVFIAQSFFATFAICCAVVGTLCICESTCVSRAYAFVVYTV